MTTRIKTRCPECGEVEVVVGEVVLSMPTGGDEGYYTFDCPSCGQEVQKGANRKVIDLLLPEEVVVEGLGIEVGENWDAAFSEELSCDGTHRWDFPVTIGQRCLCGQMEWGVDEV